MPNLTSRKTKTLHTNSLIKNQIANILQPVNGTIAITQPINKILTQNAESQGYYIPLLEKITGEQSMTVRAPLAFKNDIVTQQMAYNIGQNWVNASGGVLEKAWSSVCWSSKLGLFCAVALGNDGNVAMVSRNGSYWTSSSSGIIVGNWWSICWSPELELFCAVGEGANQQVMVSSNGLDWKSAISGVLYHQWVGVCWAPELGLFCAVSTNSGNNTNQRVMVSKDGYNWSSAISGVPASNWCGVCWAPELGLFCAVANGGGSQRVMLSKDGYNWSTETTGVGIQTWRSICWSPELGKFCAVATSGNQPVIISNDGLNWRNDTTGVANATWNSVCWAPEVGLFCSIDQNSGRIDNQKVMISSNGLDWSIATNGVFTRVWVGVCWSPELSSFCAVGQSGTTNQRVMITNPIYRLPSTMNTLSVPNVKLNNLPICNVDASNSYDLVNKSYANKYVGFDLSGGDRWECEDWISGTIKGKYNWVYTSGGTNGSATVNTISFANHIGILRLSSARSNQRVISLPIKYDTSKLKSMRFIFRFTNTSNNNLSMGIFSDIQNPSSSLNKIGFSLAGSNICGIFDSNNTATVSISVDTWYLVEIYKSSNKIQFIFNGNLYNHTLTTDFDGTIGIYYISSTASNPDTRVVYVDYIDWVVSS